MRKVSAHDQLSQDGGDTTSVTSGTENEIKKSISGITKIKRSSLKKKVQSFSHESDDGVVEPLLQKDKEISGFPNQSAKCLSSKAKTEKAIENIDDRDKFLPDNIIEKSPLMGSADIQQNGTKDCFKPYSHGAMSIHNHMNVNVFSTTEGIKSLTAPKSQMLVEIDGNKHGSYSTGPLIFTTAKIHTDGKSKQMEPVQVTPVPILSTVEGSIVKKGPFDNDERKNLGSFAKSPGLPSSDISKFISGFENVKQSTVTTTQAKVTPLPSGNIGDNKAKDSVSATTSGSKSSMSSIPISKIGENCGATAKDDRSNIIVEINSHVNLHSVKYGQTFGDVAVVSTGDGSARVLDANKNIQTISANHNSSLTTYKNNQEDQMLGQSSSSINRIIKNGVIGNSNIKSTKNIEPITSENNMTISSVKLEIDCSNNVTSGIQKVSTDISKPVNLADTPHLSKPASNTNTSSSQSILLKQEKPEYNEQKQTHCGTTKSVSPKMPITTTHCNKQAGENKCFLPETKPPMHKIPTGKQQSNNASTVANKQSPHKPIDVTTPITSSYIVSSVIKTDSSPVQTNKTSILQAESCSSNKTCPIVTPNAQSIVSVSSSVPTSENLQSPISNPVYSTTAIISKKMSEKPPISSTCKVGTVSSSISNTSCKTSKPSMSSGSISTNAKPLLTKSKTNEQSGKLSSTVKSPTNNVSGTTISIESKSVSDRSNNSKDLPTSNLPIINSSTAKPRDSAKTKQSGSQIPINSVTSISSSGKSSNVGLKSPSVGLKSTESSKVPDTKTATSKLSSSTSNVKHVPASTSTASNQVSTTPLKPNKSNDHKKEKIK